MKWLVWDTVADEMIGEHPTEDLAKIEAAKKGGTEKGYHVFPVYEPLETNSDNPPVSKPKKPVTAEPGLFD